MVTTDSDATATATAEAVVDRLAVVYSDGLNPDAFTLADGAAIPDASREAWDESYGMQHAFECLVRTIITQNTSDAASQPAFDSLMDRFDEDADLAAALAAADHEDIADAIRNAGLYNQKASVIQGVAERVRDEYGSADAFEEFVREHEPAEVRPTLLDLKGVGPKTADCVLLFAGGQAGVFPVDTHVHRIFRRMGVAPPDADHEGVREILERGVPPEKCGFGHNATIQFGRDFCTARSPSCLDGPEACPLHDLCDRVGVSPETGEVVAPSETEPPE
jgi:endonuclease-3